MTRRRKIRLTRRSFTIRLVVESTDGPAALDYFGESIERLLDAGTLQDAICEHLSDRHPVNVEIVSAFSSSAEEP